MSDNDRIVSVLKRSAPAKTATRTSGGFTPHNFISRAFCRLQSSRFPLPPKLLPQRIQIPRWRFEARQ